MQTITEILEKDHDKVKNALSDMLNSGDGAEKTRENLLAEIKQDLSLHMSFEEQVFYPEARKATGMDDEVQDGVDEHKEARQLLDEISRVAVTDEKWLSLVTSLKEALEHHIKDEQEELFPAARKNIPQERLEEMGRDYLKERGDQRVS